MAEDEELVTVCVEVSSLEVAIPVNITTEDGSATSKHGYLYQI